MILKMAAAVICSGSGNFANSKVTDPYEVVLDAK